MKKELNYFVNDVVETIIRKGMNLRSEIAYVKGIYEISDFKDMISLKAFSSEVRAKVQKKLSNNHR